MENIKKSGNSALSGFRDYSAIPWGSASEYIHIENKGNTKFTICGVKIGSSKATLMRIMKKAGFRVLLNGNFFARGETGYVKAYYKKGNYRSGYILYHLQGDDV